jgi:hypothetical protein
LFVIFSNCVTIDSPYTLVDESGRVAFWPLNKDFHLRDVTGNGNDGVAASDATLDLTRLGRFCSGYRFIGNSNSFIEFPNNGAYDTQYSLTMLAWVYPTGVRGPIFNYKRDGWGCHLLANIPDVEFVRFTRRGDLSLTDYLQHPLVLNEWNLFAATYDGGSGMAKLYLNGVQVVAKEVGVLELATNYEARMGAREGDDRYFEGTITCMQVYDRALNESEIIAAGNDPRCSSCPSKCCIQMRKTKMYYNMQTI